MSFSQVFKVFPESFKSTLAENIKLFGTPKVGTTLGEDVTNFFKGLFKSKSEAIPKSGINENIPNPSGSLKPASSLKGVTTTIATTGAAISVPLAFLTLTPGGQQLTKTTGDILTPIAQGFGSITKTVSGSPLLSGTALIGLVLIGGIILLKK